MGRPLTDRYIGRGDADNPVLYPLVRLEGTVCRGWIIKQVGSDKFLVEDQHGRKGICRLSNTADLAMDGTMCIGFSGCANGFAFRISNGKLKDWHGNTWAWSIGKPRDNEVYVHDNTAHAAK